MADGPWHTVTVHVSSTSQRHVAVVGDLYRDGVCWRL